MDCVTLLIFWPTRSTITSQYHSWRRAKVTRNLGSVDAKAPGTQGRANFTSAIFLEDGVNAFLYGIAGGYLLMHPQ